MHLDTTRQIRRIVSVLFGLVALLALTSFGRHPLKATLDNSHVAIMTWAAAQPLQFGRDIISTYGPLGHLVTAIYSPKLFLPELAAHIAINIFYIIMLFVASSKLRPVRRWAFLVGSIVVASQNYQAMYLFMLVVMAWLAFAAPNRNRVLLVAALSFAAMASLIKGTFLFFVLAVMILGLGYLALRRELRLLIVTSLSFAIAFLTAWLVAGQHVSGILDYVSFSLEVIRGYPEAMSLAPRPAILAAGIAAFAAAGIQIAVALIRHRYEPPAWFISFVLVGALFLAWKLSYSRADAHTIELFYYGIIAMLALPIFYSQPPTPMARIFDWTGIIIMSACAIFVIRDQTSLSPARICRHILERVNSNITAITHPAAARGECEAVFRRDVQALQLPQIRQTIGEATVDVFGYEQAIAIANDLNYTPRPVAQGYAAGTHALIKINAAFYRSSRAPEFVIFKLQTIDSRVPTMDDAEALLLVAQNYRPILAENGYTLLQRQKGTALSNNEVKTREAGESAVGASISIPRGMIWCQLEVRQTLLGALITFLYQPPSVWVEFGSATRQLPHQRIVPMPAANGFLINPLLRSDRDFVEFVTGNYQELEISTLKILPSAKAKGLMRSQVRYRFSEVTMPNANENSALSQ